ncbi:MAG: GIY-YIG nuclease family protein [Bacteroidales bacterium]|nr:GIY-YIG nuclease family protein [Bacteroidales bacterium]
MGKSVITYLVDGDPKGTQYAFIRNKTCQMFVVPRSNLSYLNTQEQLQKPAFYILLGEDETTKPQAYIGETENFKERVKDHDSKKSFWQKALIFVSKDADMTKVDVQYLEYKAIVEAKKANTFVLSDNKQTPKEPNLPEYQKDSMDEFFEDVKFLASFIGYNIFEITQQPKAKHLFYAKGRDYDAKGFYNSNGFIVLKGSIIAKNTTSSFNWKWKREVMLEEYTSLQNGKVILTSDITFSSPSTASSFCLGRSSNGWTIWKDKDGNSLDSVYRKQLE